MRGIARKAAICLATLFITTGLAGADTNFDPMRSLSSENVTSSPTDPMRAARAAAVTADAAEGPAASEEFGGLPDAPGAEDTYYQCVACHSTEIIKQQRLTDARWDDLWTWMIEEQGMIPPDEETKETILGYLKTHFSSES